VSFVAACCVVLSVWAYARPPLAGGRIRRRLPDGRPSPSTRPSVESPRRRGCICAASLMLLGWVVAGPVAAIAGLPAGLVFVAWIGRLESPGVTRAREEIDRDLPLAVDLLAACAASGRPPNESLTVVRRAVGGALGHKLGEISARLALGADPAREWARSAHDPQLAGLARAMQRSAESGAPLADGLTRLAEDLRRDRRTRSQIRARNVGVKAAGPLAACFLPAFMLIGVVPTVAGSFRHLFG
jgi:Flp pilus assembly protein TadB